MPYDPLGFYSCSNLFRHESSSIQLISKKGLRKLRARIIRPIRSWRKQYRNAVPSLFTYFRRKRSFLQDLITRSTGSPCMVKGLRGKSSMGFLLKNYVKSNCFSFSSAVSKGVNRGGFFTSSGARRSTLGKDALKEGLKGLTSAGKSGDVLKSFIERTSYANRRARYFKGVNK